MGVKLLPLRMSTTVVCIGNLSSGLDSITSYPGFIFDYGGMPPSVLWTISIASLVLGIVFMDLLFPLGGIGRATPFWQVLLLSLTTWQFYQAVRAICQYRYGMNIAGSISSFIFGVIVTTLTALAFKPVVKLTHRITHTEHEMLTRDAVWLSIGLGVGLTILLVVLSPIWFA